MRLTTRTNLAMRTLMFSAANPDRIITRQEVARVCNASPNHLAQVIHLLAQKKFVHTVRGRAGGLTLARAPRDICVGDVFRTFEAVLPFAECFAGAENQCPLAGSCSLKCVLSDALDAFYAKLDAVTLEDLMRNNRPLQTLLHVA